MVSFADPGGRALLWLPISEMPKKGIIAKSIWLTSMVEPPRFVKYYIYVTFANIFSVRLMSSPRPREELTK